MNATPVGIDIAKSVFQMHYVDAQTGEIVSRALRRAAFLEHFANRAPCLIGIEACGGAQYRARSLMKIGHQVRLMLARFVKAFNIGNMRPMRVRSGSRCSSRVRRWRSRPKPSRQCSRCTGCASN